MTTIDVRTARTVMHGRPMRYVYRPGAASRSPVLVVLHGFGEGGDSRKAVKYGPLAARACCPEQWCVVAPICRRFHWWCVKALFAFLDELAQTYGVPLSRVCIVGVSMGAYVIWRMLAMRPTDLGAAVIVSGSPRRILSTFGVLQAQGFDARLLRAIKTPVWVAHGSLDLVAPCRDALRAFGMLEQSPHKHARLYAWVGHTGAMSKAFREPELYAWIGARLG